MGKKSIAETIFFYIDYLLFFSVIKFFKKSSLTPLRTEPNLWYNFHSFAPMGEDIVL